MLQFEVQNVRSKPALGLQGKVLECEISNYK